MTGIRECQAIMSVRLINKTLQNIILHGTNSINPPSNTNATTPIDAVKLGSSTNSNSSSKNDSMSITVRCPETVPQALWKSLCKIYNHSQLEAIQAAAMRYKTTNTPDELPHRRVPVESSLTLLQGDLRH